MGKYKYLFKNIGLMTVSSFTSKILSFLLVPLYTSVLTTAEYGTYDIYITSILLLTPLLSANILDAVIRFPLDKDNSPKTVFSVGLKYCVRAVVICIVLVALNRRFRILDTLTEFPVCFVLYFTFSLFSDLMNQFARGIERVFDVAVAGIINSAAVVSLNLYFLLVLRMGLLGYFLSYIIAYALSSLYLFFRLRAWRYVELGAGKKPLQREMVTYSRPMILQNIGAWINNLSDRYVVTWLCGAAANGIYSVAYKIPSILTVFQMIFNQAWTISAVRSYDDGQENFYVSIYRAYNIGLVLFCSGLIVANKWIAGLLFAKEFFTAWEYAPFLIISVVFSSLAGLLGGIFIAAKRSDQIAKTTLAGAVVNTVLNVVLVYFMGPVGAAIATLVSYFLVWIVRLFAVRKLMRLSVRLWRDLVLYLILVCQASLLLFVPDGLVLYGLQLLGFGAIVFLSLSDIKDHIKMILNKLGRGRGGEGE